MSSDNAVLKFDIGKLVNKNNPDSHSQRSSSISAHNSTQRYSVKSFSVCLQKTGSLHVCGSRHSHFPPLTFAMNGFAGRAPNGARESGS